jgi:hypothetical protein
VIYALVFETQQIVGGFWFLGLLFCGLGWFVVCVDIALFFCKQLTLWWAEFCEELGFNLSPAIYFMFFLKTLFVDELTCSTC